MFKNALNLIYPNTCAICEKINKLEICKKCEIELKKHFILQIDKYKNKYFKEHLYIFKYEGIIRKKLIEYKFNNKPYLYKLFVKILNNSEKICGFLIKYDIITSVPMSRLKKNLRGYNQSELIIKHLPNFTNKILFKIKNNSPQSELNRDNRIINVENVYVARNIETIKNKKILIFDDIYTTGSTVNECSRILKIAGAKEIGVLTIAKTKEEDEIKWRI